MRGSDQITKVIQSIRQRVIVRGNILKNTRVLIVEDSKPTANLLSQYLGRFRVGSIQAHTIAETLDALSKCDAYDCILLDLNLPDSRGVESITTVEEKCPNIPIIVVTGSADLLQDAVYAGAQDALVKPVDVDDLIYAVRKAVARHKVRMEYRPFNEAIDRVEEKINQMIENVDKGVC